MHTSLSFCPSHLGANDRLRLHQGPLRKVGQLSVGEKHSYVEFDIIVRSLLSGLDREYEPARIDSKRAIILASVCSCSDLIFGDHTDSNPLAELDRMYTVPSK